MENSRPPRPSQDIVGPWLPDSVWEMIECCWALYPWTRWRITEAYQTLLGSADDVKDTKNGKCGSRLFFGKSTLVVTPSNTQWKYPLHILLLRPQGHRGRAKANRVTLSRHGKRQGSGRPYEPNGIGPGNLLQTNPRQGNHLVPAVCSPHSPPR